ncbi:MAG: DUF3810 family protein [Saprospiraceae bacterium]
MLFPVMNKRRWFFWPSLLLLALAGRALAPDYWVEEAYGSALFPVIRAMSGFISSLSPLPLVYLLLAGLVVYGFWVWRAGKAGFRPLQVLSVLSFWAFTFLLLWGFNYQRIPFAKKAGLDAKPLDAIAIEEEFDWAIARILESRQALGNSISEPVSQFYGFESLEDYLFPRVQHALGSWGYPADGRVRARRLYPKGILLRFSSSGVYLPWTGEGHLDAGLHPLNWPFVMAHEMSHGYGIADEGVCNFLAYQVCAYDPDPYIRYTGTLYYWRYAAYEMRRFCPIELEEAIQALPEGIRADLSAIRDYADRYPDLIPQWRDLVYDSFLKSQGLRDGVLSYDQVLVLAHAFRTQ